MKKILAAIALVFPSVCFANGAVIAATGSMANQNNSRNSSSWGLSQIAPEPETAPVVDTIYMNGVRSEWASLRGPRFPDEAESYNELHCTKAAQVLIRAAYMKMFHGGQLLEQSFLNVRGAATILEARMAYVLFQRYGLKTVMRGVTILEYKVAETATVAACLGVVNGL